MATQFTGIPGQLVSLEETVSSFEEILDGKVDHIPEQDFMLKGGIEQVKEAFAKREK